MLSRKLFNVVSCSIFGKSPKFWETPKRRMTSREHGAAAIYRRKGTGRTMDL
jgi:hypothetical protein